mgnify:CR=1 FL=1
MNKIVIIGGGLTGLSCAFKLIQMEIKPSNITIFEARQEIGSPTRSPGIAKKSKNINILIDKIKLQPLTLLNLDNNLFTFRREWLEKSLSIYLTKLGCNINLKTTITELLINKFDENTTIINCAGFKRKSSGFPGDFTNFINSKKIMIKLDTKKLIPWNGYLSIINQENKFNENFISINKKDNLNETWTCNIEEQKNKGNKFIEIIKSYFPNSSHEILANNTIDRGFLLANKIRGTI